MLAVLLAALVGTVGAVPSAAQSVSYVQRQWTVEEGLPVNSVNAVQQGPQGYLWMATYDGLVRFDGVEWTVYRSATEPALPGNRFLELVLGAEGNLWTALESGELVRVAPRTEQFRVFSSESSPLPGSVTALRREGDTLWVGTTGGLAFVRDGRLHRAPLDSTRTVQHVAPGSGSDLWVGTNRGVYVLRGDTTALVPAVDGPERPTVQHLEWTGTRLWVASFDGVYTLRDGRLHRPFSNGPGAKPRSAIYVHEDASGTLWVGIDEPTTKGLYVRRDGQLRLYKEAGFRLGSGVQTGPRGHQWILAEDVLYREGRPVLTVDGRLQDLFFDREGNVWVATSRDGVYRLRRSPFTVYGRPEGLASGNVYPIYEGRSEPGTIWIGTLGGGLARLRNGSVRTFGPEEGVPGIVWALHEDRKGRLWVGSESDFCFFRNGQCSKQGLPDALANRREVRAIYEDKQGRLWVGTDQHGLYRRRGGTWTHLAPDVTARVIEQTRNGSLWMGTNGRGLFRYRNGRFSRLTPEDGLSSALIRAIHEDSTGALWIGTENKGINRIDRQGTPTLVDDSIAVIRKRDGLFDNVISQILPDGHGRLWMSSNRGLFWVRREALHAVADGRAERVWPVSYTEEEGLRSREANGGMQPAGIRASSGALWFPTQEGAVRIHPSDLQTDETPPFVAIERIRTDSASHQATAPVQLPVGTRNFEVTFTGLNFDNPDALTFHYRLHGFEEQGKQVTERRRAAYTNVPPGRYTFEVRARTSRGTWSAGAATVRIVVPPHWWETGWFFVLCAFGLVGLGVGAYRWRVRRLRKQQEELEATVAQRTEEVRRQRDKLEEQAERLQALDEAKSRFFANLSHEFRTPLTLIRGPVQEVRTHLEQGRLEAVPAEADADAEQLSLVERNADRLQRLVDQLLGLARMEADTYELNARPTDVGAVVARLARRFEPLAERAGIALTAETDAAPGVDVPSEAAEEPVYVDREALERILSNLLSNAIKFTSEGGTVTVSVRERADAVELSVRDTGSGIPEDQQDRIFDRFAQAQETSDSSRREQEGIGIGLAFTNDLVDVHGGTIDLDSTVGEGTTVTVRFPRGREHLRDDQVAAPSPDDQTAADLDQSDPAPATPGGSSPSREEEQASEETSTSAAPTEPQNSDAKIVLVVDDNADVRRYVRSVLRPEFDVIEAADGAEGLDLAREALPDVILADVMMPTVDGHEMTRRLKDDPETEAIPVIMVTARAETQDEVAGLQIGADDYVTKPFDADVLRQRVGGVLTLQQRLRRRLEAELRDAAPEPATEERPEIVRTARRVAREHLTDPDFNVEALAEKMAMSRSTLYRKLSGASDHTPSSLLTTVRIEQARTLLDEGEPVTQVAYAVGYDTLSTFSRVFREEVGTAPSSYAEE